MILKYIYHSGFVLEFEKINIIFDYYKGEIPKLDINKKLFVVVTHSHSDHYNKKIFEIFSDFKDVVYLLSDDIELDDKSKKLVEKSKNTVHLLKPREEYNIDGIKIQTLESTDLGIAILIYAENKQIYHSGDLNWWTWHGYETEEEYQIMTERYLREMELLKKINIDLAMVVLDPRQGERYDWGMKYFIENTNTKFIAPMHCWNKYEVIDRFRNDNSSLLDNTTIIDTQKTNVHGFEIE